MAAPDPKSPAPPAHRLGELGEALVADWLRQQGWQIIAQRWHCRWGELDLVAARHDPTPELAFVEVKSRGRGSLDGVGRWAITAKKRQKLWRSAEVFLAQWPDYGDWPCRFDVALVEKSSSGRQGGLLHRAIADGGYVLTLVDYLHDAFQGD